VLYLKRPCSVCAGITHIGGGNVVAIRASSDGLLLVEIVVSSEDGKTEVRSLPVHQLLSCCGFRPDMSIYEELQVCYVLPT
jgi:hypothetical protein